MKLYLEKLGEDNWSYRCERGTEKYFASSDAALAAAVKKFAALHSRFIQENEDRAQVVFFLELPAHERAISVTQYNKRWGRNYQEDDEPPPRPKVHIHEAAPTGEQLSPAWGSVGQGSRWKRPRRYWEDNDD